MQCQNTPDEGKGDVDQHEPRIPDVTKQHKEQHKDGDEANRNDLRQPPGGPYLILKLSCPLNVIARRHLDVPLNGLTCLSNRTPEIASSDGKLYANKSTVIVAVDKRRAGTGSNRSNFLEGNLTSS